MNKILNYSTFCWVFILFFLVHFSLNKENFYHTIKSDGEGYYAYLPALIHLKDPTFKKNKEVKNLYVRYEDDVVLKTKDHKFINKYFGGVSFVALPGYLGISLINKIVGYPTDGYHISYMVGMFFYSFLLFCAGFWYLMHLIKKEWNLRGANQFVFLVFLLTTPWLFMALYQNLYANAYLMPLMAGLLGLLLKFKNGLFTKLNWSLFCFLVGIILIIRPTALIVFLMIPYVFGSVRSVLAFIKLKLFKFSIILLGFFFFLIPVVYQFGTWYWQTGSFFNWSYSGEGFNWFHPEMIEVLFGYRTGILFHSPILFVSLFAAILLYKENKVKTIFYVCYFFLQVYISASWWCFDFETKYGLRNFNEQYVFLFLPLLDFLKIVKQKKFFFLVLIVCSVIPSIRFIQLTYGYNSNQRFKAETFWKSLLAWKEEDKGRFQFQTSAQTFGELKDKQVLNFGDSYPFQENEEFFLTHELPVDLKSGERYYIKVDFDKVMKVAGENVYFIYEMSDTLGKIRSNYNVVVAAEDILNPKEKVKIRTFMVNNLEDKNKLKIYFWNKDKVAGKLNNVHVIVEKYAQH